MVVMMTVVVASNLVGCVGCGIARLHAERLLERDAPSTIKSVAGGAVMGTHMMFSAVPIVATYSSLGRVVL